MNTSHGRGDPVRRLRTPKRKTATTTDSWCLGYAAALAEIWRLHHDGQMVRHILAAGGLTLEHLESGGVEPYDLDAIRAALQHKNAVTDDQIRLLCREDPSLLDTLMIAIHSTNHESRDLARSHFAALWKTRTRR